MCDLLAIAVSVLYRAIDAACAAYASINLSLLHVHYITLHVRRPTLRSGISVI